jgi:hypothetical protein
VLTRNYTIDKYEEYIVAVKDLIKSSNDVETAQRMCQVNATHHRVPHQEIDMVLSFLHSFAQSRYPIKSLTRFDARIKMQGM